MFDEREGERTGGDAGVLRGGGSEGEKSAFGMVVCCVAAGDWNRELSEENRAGAGREGSAE